MPAVTELARERPKSKKARAAERRRRARRKRIISRVGSAVAVVVVLAVVISALSGSETFEGNTDIESWDLPALEGDGRVALADFEGKPTVAAFFASWCDVCRRELPGFALLEERIGHEVNFVGINTMNNGTGLHFAEQHGIGDWPLARDIGSIDGRQLAVNFGARGSPTTVIYDEQGSVVDVNLGRLTAGQLQAKLAQFFGISG